MPDKTLSAEEWDEYAREFWKSVTVALTRDHGDASRLARLLGLQRGSVSDLRRGKSTGSSSVNLRMLFLLAGITDQQAKKLLDNPKHLVNAIEAPSSSPSTIDKLYFELKDHYSDNELAAWFKLLLSKRELENGFGVSIKASLKKKK